MSGRKIIVDAYGPTVPNGGGALCGKDITKIDRIGNYYARYIAKNVVAAGLCDEIKVEISYIIGNAKYAGIQIDTFGTCHIRGGDAEVIRIIKAVFAQKTDKMVREFNQRKIHFFRLSRYGHYG